MHYIQIRSGFAEGQTKPELNIFECQACGAIIIHTDLHDTYHAQQGTP